MGADQYTIHPSVSRIGHLLLKLMLQRYLVLEQAPIHIAGLLTSSTPNENIATAPPPAYA